MLSVSISQNIKEIPAYGGSARKCLGVMLKMSTARSDESKRAQQEMAGMPMSSFNDYSRRHSADLGGNSSNLQ